MKMNPVVHFEMPYEDQQRVVDFYTKVFGWQTTVSGPEMGHYIVATTTETDQAGGRPKNPGAINGGFFRKADGKKPIPSVVIGVDDIKEHVKKVAEAGGKIFGEPIEIPTVGWYVSFEDSEGNIVSLLQPSR